MSIEENYITYNPGACSTCHQPMVELTTCGQCIMTNYCSKECQKKNWMDHKEVCEFAGKVRNSYFKELKKLSMKRHKFISNKIKKLIERLLPIYHMSLISEREALIFYYPRICYCGEHDCAILKACPKCFSTFYCKESHFNTEAHFAFCEAYQMRNHIRFSISNKDKHDRAIFDDLNCEVNILETDMTKFLETLTGLKLSEDPGRLALLSLQVTYPLTLLYTLTKIPPKYINLKNSDEFVVHVIGTYSEVFSTSWNVITWVKKIPFIENVSKVRIVFAGSDVYINYSRTDIVNSRKYTFELFNMDYTEYMKSKEFVEPNVMIIFNMFDDEIWNELLNLNLKIPIILSTSLCTDLLYTRIEELESVIAKSSYIIETELNPFCSLYPLIDPFTEFSVMNCRLSSKRKMCCDDILYDNRYFAAIM